MLIVDKNTSKIDEVKKKLCKSFSMKDLGHSKQNFCMRIARLRDERNIYLSQKKYIERVLDYFNMKNAKPVSTPLDGHKKLRKKMCPTFWDEKESMTKDSYYSIVGSLIWCCQQISRQSRKRALGSCEVNTQKCVALSTTEAEYIAATESDKEMI
uniref:Reverse transcriptase Ty1/copia-type domain-containing protein n=1 Tax=Solanum lycopersicum TaxID=4081 RepID=A0A3Q7G1W2_SOLLC